MKAPLARPILRGEVNFPFCLAPMVGISHIAFREALRSYLPEGASTIWPTEMLNSRKVHREDLSQRTETLKGPLETGMVPQILGNTEEDIRLTVQALKSWGAEGIDINMGCPVNKALKHNYGVALMGDADYAADVVRFTVNSSDLPVSVKLRAGLQGDKDFLLRFGRKLEEAGASWLCLHPRMAAQKRRGLADWSQIKMLREEVLIPVIGNGDIQVYADVLAMFQQTDCDAVMAGRALTARPWMLWQLGEVWGFKNPPGRMGRAPSQPYEEGEEMGRFLKDLLLAFRKYFPESLGLRKMTFFLKNSSPWLEFGHHLMAKTSSCKSYSDLEIVFEDFFSQAQKMSQTTELRY